MKLYTVRHFVKANSVKEAIKLSKQKEPDDVYLSDEWMNKVGMLGTTDKDIEGFKKRKIAYARSLSYLRPLSYVWRGEEAGE